MNTRNPLYFTFTDRSWNDENRSAVFAYEIGFDNGEILKFSETVIFPNIPTRDVSQETLEWLLDNLHIILGISYYKMYCPLDLRMPYKLSRAQAQFWNIVYLKGLGEFAYRNSLDLRDKIKFPYCDDGGAMMRPRRITFQTSNRALVGIGGGKDSIVAVEMIKQSGIPCDGFIVETYTSHDIADEICKVSGINSIKIRRMLDKQALSAPPDAYNGHIPISAIYAWIGMMTACLFDYKYVVVSNEHSSNFGNLEYLGELVNHQWSKSAEFEHMFQEYSREIIGDAVTYFSIARPFFEIRIAQMLANYPQYFAYFTGCNRKFRINAESRPNSLWCCECSKCSFVYLMLAPFLPRQTLKDIFGKDMLDDISLSQQFLDITGFGDIKPFDCVGTFEEAQAAMHMISDKYNAVIVREIAPRITNGSDLARMVMTAQKALTVPTPFRMCGMNSVLILGFGKEGKVSADYIMRRYAGVKVASADQSDDKDYLDKQSEFDIVVKTPGIPKSNVYRQYITATNLFFSQYKGITVGVTGSKGKSTTASLIAHILSTASRNVELIGNIGDPMLAHLESANQDSIAVVEMSSYQLDDIEYSPHIAVITSLFPEHMDYHGNEEMYYIAKKNIIKYQNANDIFIYNPRFDKLSDWAREANANAVPYDDLPFSPSIITLVGEHNLDNARAAVSVALRLGINVSTIAEAVSTFQSLPHRLQLIHTSANGIRFYDDAISTTPESTIAALKAISGIGTIILGGMDRGYEFSQLAQEIKKYGIKNAVLFPESGRKILQPRKGMNVLETSSMQSAVRFALEHTEAGDAVLLSCASPSYGLWKNFEEKGDEFQKEVLRATDARKT